MSEFATGQDLTAGFPSQSVDYIISTRLGIETGVDGAVQVQAGDILVTLAIHAKISAHHDLSSLQGQGVNRSSNIIAGVEAGIQNPAGIQQGEIIASHAVDVREITADQNLSVGKCNH